MTLRQCCDTVMHLEPHAPSCAFGPLPRVTSTQRHIDRDALLDELRRRVGEVAYDSNGVHLTWAELSALLSGGGR